MYNRGLFHDWVPKPLMLLLIIFMLIVLLFINPIYSANVGLMVGSTGIISEYFMWGIFAQTIGLGGGLPLIMRLKMRFRSKELMITALIVMALMSVVIATTHSAGVIVGACLIFGFVKMSAMAEIVLPMRAILSPKNDNGRFYSLFYPIAIGLGQIGVMISAKFTQNVEWQMVHIYTAALLFACALLCVIVMHNKHFMEPMPLTNMDWSAVVLFMGSLLCFSYVVTFGKQQDWFNSPNIRFCTIGAVVLAVILVVRGLKLKNPLIKFGIYNIGSVRLGLVLLVGQGILLSAASVQTIYSSAILGYSWANNAYLGMMMMTGIITAGVVAFFWTKHHIPLRMYVFTGFAAYIIYYTILYFKMVPGLNIESFMLPQFFNGYAMCSLFIAVWIHIVAKIPQKDMIYSVAPLMVFRSVISITLFSGIVSWFQYKFQLESVANLAVGFDGIFMASNPEAGSLSSVQLGALLAANKKLLGYIIIIGFAFLTFILFHQFGDFKYKIGYYYSRNHHHKEENSLEDEKTGGSIVGVVNSYIFNIFHLKQKGK